MRIKSPLMLLSFVLLVLTVGFTPMRAGAITTTVDQAIEAVRKPWQGDFDGMVKRRAIRALVPYSKTFYFLDGPTQKGITFEALKEYEKFINKGRKKKALKIEVIVVPTPRDQLFQDLADGKGDLAAANLTITEERKKLVDFSKPFGKNVNEILVTPKTSKTLASADEMAGMTVYTRQSASYYESLIKLNERLDKAGKKPVEIKLVDGVLEDEDLLEMVNAGVIPAIVMDNHKAELWANHFKEITLHTDATLRTGGEIAWAFRKNSPQFEKSVNAFNKTAKKGTLLGNILFKRYFKNTKWMTNALDKQGTTRFHDTAPYFQLYSDEYAFDWMLAIAQGYQESRLDQSAKSHVGAIGVMQLLPTTAADPNVNIKDIHIEEKNIQAGIKYMRFMIDTYFPDEEIDDFNKGLLALASYNAGPNRIRRLRKKTAEMGLDPNVWFGNVEKVVARHVGREPVTYVANIFKYSVAYREAFELAYERDRLKEAGAKIQKSN